MSSNSTTITIRISTSDAQRLDALARARNAGRSEVARDAILGHLDGASEPNIRAEVAALRTEVNDLRRALSESVKALLLTSERVTKEKVNEFIKRTFEE